MKIVGTGGQLRVGYQVAAEVGRWTISASGYQPQISFTIEARLTDRNEYWINQSPIALSLRMGNRKWTWENVTISGYMKIIGELSGSPFIT